MNASSLMCPPKGYSSYQVFYSHTDSSYVLVGGNMMIGKLDANTFASRWHYIYGDEGYSNVIDDVIVLNDGSIVASGGYSPAATINQTDVRGAILKTDKDGNLEWFSGYNNLVTGSTPNALYGYREFFLGIDTTLEGGYIVCGTILDQHQAKAWAVKTNSLGCGAANCETYSLNVQNISVVVQTINVTPTSTVDTTGLGEVASENLKFEIYPNPASGEISLILNPSTRGKGLVTIRITDMLGNETLCRAVLKTHESIDISGLTEGVYFVSMYQAGNHT